MNHRRSAPSAVRNRAAILDALQQLIPSKAEVLEIGSGTGEHAVYFASAMPDWHWHTSDLPENHPAIQAWIEHSGATNVNAPRALDVLDGPADVPAVDVLYTANTAHIMSVAGVVATLELAGQAIRPGGRLVVYGPFRIEAQFSTASNARFDADLRARDPEMGIRDLEWMDRQALSNGLVRSDWYAMPSNNYLLAWTREPG